MSIENHTCTPQKRRNPRQCMQHPLFPHERYTTTYPAGLRRHDLHAAGQRGGLHLESGRRRRRHRGHAAMNRFWGVVEGGWVSMHCWKLIPARYGTGAHASSSRGSSIALSFPLQHHAQTHACMHAPGELLVKVDQLGGGGGEPPPGSRPRRGSHSGRAARRDRANQLPPHACLLPVQFPGCVCGCVHGFG